MSVVPGVETFHGWSAWVDPRKPITGPAANRDLWDTFVLHYTAADDLIDGDPGEHAEDLPAYLRGMQRYYVDSRDYSVGYNFAVDWLGGVWMLRGFGIKCAANRNWNHRTIAVLCLVDGGDPMTAEAVASVNAIYAEAERRCGRSMNLVPHSAIGSTSCCGDGIRAQIASGVIRPTLPTPLPPPVPPITEDDDMNLFLATAALRRHSRTGAIFLTSALDFCQHVDAGQVAHYTKLGVKTVPLANEDVFESYVAYLSGGLRPAWALQPLKSVETPNEGDMT